ncbi:hypothetical protein [Enterococcus sp. AZ163]|uniref:hypothetical protein n=1 Tax=Enterococcus sp. AZ163 TaxID=2774638 RepID=UPI003D2C154E
MQGLKINVERTGFPIELGGHKFFFDCSTEHIEEYEEKFAAVGPKLEKLEQGDDTIEDYKKALTIGYDAMLGEGTFEKLYDSVPDVVAWINAFYTLAEGIAEKVSEVQKEQSSKSDELKKQYLKKKKKKSKR